jgi:formylglycine-generating enzyme required for sulfatase activity
MMNMRRMLRSVLPITFVILAFHVPVMASGEEEVLTNDSIIEMVGMGLPEEIVLSKIKASKCDFDTSSEALMQLMKKGIKVKILKAMISEDTHPSKLCGEASPGREAALGTSASPFGPGSPGDMVMVLGGCFNMGDVFGSGVPDEKPVHEVCVDDFYIGRYEVTVGEFREFMEEEGYDKKVSDGNCYYHTGERWIKDKRKNWKKVSYPQTDRDPVTCVSWNDAMEYIKWKGIKDGRMYRLPTEAEWEYAARSGGKNYLYSWGHGTPSGNVADEMTRQEFPDWFIWEGYNDGYVHTAPVGSFEHNELGIYDMTGNVWEWVGDWYSPEYYANSPLENPKGPENGASRMVRGGSWFNMPDEVRTTHRSWNKPTLRNFYNGFRLAASE